MKKSIIFCLMAGILFGCSKYQPGEGIPLERQREYASALFNQKLYIQSILEYNNLLNRYKLDKNTRANVNYMIGNIFFDQLGDYQNALYYYYKIKHVFRESNLVDEANKKIVACFERLGRSFEAAAALKDATSLIERDSPFERLPGDTVAIVAGDPLTTGELDRFFDYYFNSLLPEERNEGKTREKKLTFLRDYVKSEVLYNTAKRQNLDQDKKVVEVAYLQKKNLMVERLLQNEVYDKINIKDPEIEQYYNDNKDKFVDKSQAGKERQLTLEEATNTIYQLLFTQQAQKLQDQLTDRYIDAQNAQLFIDKVK
ncbi:hypothetical protein AMJ80_09890 [bacterium SM23_31]|nr:MAG: hypothetical protein AMJ80_09890 [bacterium SM23_31]